MNMSGVTARQARGSLLFAFVGMKTRGHVVHAEEEGEREGRRSRSQKGRQGRGYE